MKKIHIIRLLFLLAFIVFMLFSYDLPLDTKLLGAISFILAEIQAELIHLNDRK